jgi:hypothetical protein
MRPEHMCKPEVGGGPEGASMRRRIGVGVVLLILLILALIGYRLFIEQIPCGRDLLLNGSFESGNFQPDPDGSMNLDDSNSSALFDWTVRVSAKSKNPLRWSQNDKALDGTHLINLAGFGNPPPEPYPGLSQGNIPLQPGRYRLRFALGQDRDRFPGPGSADVIISGAVVNQRPRFATVADGPNWQEFLWDFEVANNDTVAVSFSATAHQRIVRYIGLDKVSLNQLQPRFRCPPR